MQPNPSSFHGAERVTVALGFTAEVQKDFLLHHGTHSSVPKPEVDARPQLPQLLLCCTVSPWVPGESIPVHSKAAHSFPSALEVRAKNPHVGFFLPRGSGKQPPIRIVSPPVFLVCFYPKYKEMELRTQRGNGRMCGVPGVRRGEAACA